MNVLRRVVLSVTLILSACAVESQTSEELVQEGDTHLQNGDVAAAHASYSQAVAADPNDPDANAMMALASLMNAYEQPSANLEALFTAWDFTYTRDLYAPITDNISEMGDPFLIPSTATSENYAIDTLKTELSNVIDGALGNIQKITDPATPWSRLVDSETIPGSSPGSEEEIDLTDAYFAEAGLHLTKFLLEFFGGYDLDIDHATYNAAPEADIDQARIDAEPDILTVRNLSSFTDARNSLYDGLVALDNGLNELRDNPESNGVVMRSGLIGDVVSDGWDSTPVSITKVQDIVTEVLDALDTETHAVDLSKFTESDEDPVMVRLGRLFTHPIDRSDIDAGYDFDLEQIKWDTLDATLNGALPETTVANVQTTLDIDTDEDGISADNDQCPDTPAGQTVNSNGCTPVQLQDLVTNLQVQVTDLEVQVTGLQAQVDSSYVLHLEAGWNLVSLGKEPQAFGVTDILGNAHSGAVWTWQDGRFQTTTTMQSQKGYWIYAVEQAEIEVQLP